MNEKSTFKYKALKWSVYYLDCGTLITQKVYSGNFIDCSFYIAGKDKQERLMYCIRWDGYYD